jgi:hypothetical protein
VTKETAEVTRLDGEVNALVTKLAGLNTQITAAENAILSLQNRLTPLQTSLNTLNTQISEKEAALTAAKADLNTLDGKIVTQSATLRALESAKKVNRDAVAAQKVVVAACRPSTPRCWTGSPRSTDDRTGRLPRLIHRKHAEAPQEPRSWGASLFALPCQKDRRALRTRGPATALRDTPAVARVARRVSATPTKSASEAATVVIALKPESSSRRCLRDAMLHIVPESGSGTALLAGAHCRWCRLALPS